MDPNEEQIKARVIVLTPFIVAALPALIAQQRPAENPSEPGEAARLSADQIVEIAHSAREIAEAILEVIALPSTEAPTENS